MPPLRSLGAHLTVTVVGLLLLALPVEHFGFQRLADVRRERSLALMYCLMSHGVQQGKEAIAHLGRAAAATVKPTSAGALIRNDGLSSRVANGTTPGHAALASDTIQGLTPCAKRRRRCGPHVASGGGLPGGRHSPREKSR